MPVDSDSDSEVEERAPPKRGRKPRSYTSNDSSDTIKDNFKGKKTKERTKSNYGGKLNQIKEYFEANHPEALVEGEVVAPIPSEPLMNFFSYIFIGAHERGKLAGPDFIPPGDPDPYSTSQVKGYRSAVVFLYTEKADRSSLKLVPTLIGSGQNMSGQEVVCLIWSHMVGEYLLKFL